VLGGDDKAGRGFYQLMDGIEVGRVNVAARGCGVAHRAFELAVSYARSRRTFGKIIGEHQAISFKLAEMATKTVAAHQMIGEGTSEIQKMIIGQRIVSAY
jgi:alkylation response protein AidB-like acyl-CoA dehydrogenase